MKRLFILLIFLFLTITCFADDPVRGRLNIAEEDGDPSTFPYLLKVTNGSLTNNGDGTASLAVGGHDAVTVTDTATLDLTLTGQDVKGDVILLKDLVAGTGLSGGADNVLVGPDSDVTLTLDPTEVNDATWGDNTDASIAWTYDVSGATHPILTFTDASFSANVPITSTGASSSMTASKGYFGTLYANTGNNITFGNTGLITTTGGFTIATGKNLTIGTTQWNSGDSIDGTKVANADLGDIGVSSGVWSVEDDSHDHSAAGSTVTINASDIIDKNAGTDITADLEEEAHAAEHAVSAADTVFPADPNADKYLMWDDDPGTLVWADAGVGSGATTALDNLASVAINTSLISDTANTDDLGTEALYWRKSYLASEISFEGATDNDYQTTLSAVDTTLSDKTINIPDASGTIAVSATAPATLSVLGDIGITVLKDLVTTAPLTGSTNDILVGADADVTIALTTGIANTNAVVIDAADVADNDYAKFTASGLEGRSYSEVLSDIGAQAADNDLTTWAGITPGANVGTFLATPSSANLYGAITDETGTGTAVFNNSPTFDDDIQLGKAGATGILKLYSEQGVTDYTASLYPNTAMTSAASFYLPADEPAAQSFLSMSTGGVMSFVAPHAGTNIASDLEEEVTEGSLADSTIVSADIKNGTIVAADTAITAGRSLTWSTDDLVADAETYSFTKCIYWENPVATDDFKSIWYTPIAATITSIWAESDQTVTFMLQTDDGSPSDMDTVDLAPAAGVASDTSLNGDNTLAAGDRVDMAVTSVANTPTWCSVCFSGTYDD